MISFKNLGAVGLVLFAIGCGGGGGSKAEVKDAGDHKGVGGQAVSKKAEAGFKLALDAFVQNEKAATWTDASCKGVADQFIAASSEQKSAGGSDLPEAIYNAGLAYQRCGDDANAKAKFEDAYKMDKKFHRARAQLALYKYKDSGNLDATISELTKIIEDAGYQNVEGLVAVASLQMQRGGTGGGKGCNDDQGCAKLNLQRALAIDDSFMPAFNQLAIYYLNQARGESGKKKGSGLIVAATKKKRINKQRLDLAALVASQAQKKNPNYAPIHNTTGLILVEMENYNGAVKAFKRAISLNAKFFEAQMNYAAVNLSFRGFGEAEKAYRAAIALRPDTYEAHLGLALALRGGIDPTNFEKNVAGAKKHLAEAKKLEPARPETYFNEAILFEEFVAKRQPTPQAQIAQFKKAIEQYNSFVAKAGSKDGFKDAVKVAKDRVQDLNDTIQFTEETIKMEAEEKKRQAAIEAKKKADAAAPKPDAAADGDKPAAETPAK